MTPKIGVDRRGVVVYQEIKHTEIRQGNCSACGGQTNRQRTFSGVVHPMNRTKAGVIKTPAQVRADLLRSARQWQANHDHHNCPAIRAERVARKLKAGK